MIRLAIAAESAVVRAGLEALARSHAGIELAGAYRDFGALEALHPDVVLAAVPLEELSAPATGRSGLVLLTADPHPVWTQEAFRSGGAGAALAGRFGGGNSGGGGGGGERPGGDRSARTGDAAGVGRAGAGVDGRRTL